MTYSPIVFSLPTADRPRAHAFYKDGLGLAAIGTPAEDGVPEPLQFVLNDHSRLMLVPRDGFGWVIGKHEVAGPGTSECVLGVSADTEAEVDGIVLRARQAGATIVAEPASQPWGYAASFADSDGHLWMVTCAPPPR